MIPIVSAEDFPEYIVTWKDTYAEMDSKTYYPIYMGRIKKTKGCFTMGFKVEERWCIEITVDDLKMVGVTFVVQSVQQLKTDSTIAYLGITIRA